MMVVVEEEQGKRVSRHTKVPVVVVLGRARPTHVATRIIIATVILLVMEVVLVPMMGMVYGAFFSRKTSVSVQYSELCSSNRW